MFPIHDDTERVHGRPYLNYALIAINVAVFVWEITVDPSCIVGCQDPRFLLQYGSVPDVIFGDPERGVPTILTSMFMHAGIAHILGNMIFLWVFGDNIEDKFGRVKYILIYLGWGALAALAHSYFAMATGGGAVPAVGASGAISGILGAYLVLFPRAKVYTVIAAFFIFTVRIPVIAYIPFWFILQLIFAVIGQSGGVAYVAHVGGFVAGAVTGLAARSFMMPALANLAGTGKTYVPPGRKLRPKIEDIVADTQPEVIEGPDYYEVIAEIRGVSDASEISAEYHPSSNSVRIVAKGVKRYEMYAALPQGAVTPKVEYIQYLNGIARVRLTKTTGQV